MAAAVMPVPRAELKLVRLLSRCEALAADRRGPDEWRLEKYVSALEEMLLDLKKHSSKPAPEVLNEYSRKVDFLKGLLEADKLVRPVVCGLPSWWAFSPTAEGRAASSCCKQKLPFFPYGVSKSPYRFPIGRRDPSRLPVGPCIIPSFGRSLFLAVCQLLGVPVAPSPARLPFLLGRCASTLPSLPLSACRSPSAGLWPFLCTSPPADEHRQNLFLLPSPDLEETSLRKRTGPLPDEKQSAAELDAVLQHHHSIQEKLAEEMLHLARNLKNNTLVAQNVIKQDNQTLSHSLKLADHNFEKLKDESDRLEQHAKKSVNWFLWLMLIVVCFIFISMILFIRIFPKLR
ncbi:vesicle transport protein USE1 [Podarcis muralis]